VIALLRRLLTGTRVSLADRWLLGEKPLSDATLLRLCPPERGERPSMPGRRPLGFVRSRDAQRAAHL
jgi:hypothetical protein